MLRTESEANLLLLGAHIDNGNRRVDGRGSAMYRCSERGWRQRTADCEYHRGEILGVLAVIDIDGGRRRFANAVIMRVARDPDDLDGFRLRLDWRHPLVENLADG